MFNILVTGSAGFIGFHLCKNLLNRGYNITGVDNLNDYYDPKLKLARLDALNELVKKSNLNNSYKFIKLDISCEEDISSLFKNNNFDIVINMAAQAGVRYSIENPKAYIESNIVGFHNILYQCKEHNVDHFIYASSSSVYGMSKTEPFKVSQNTDHPISLYAATKKSNELMAFSYSHLYDMPITGLRFFTVYGPFGRPDMAYYKFAKAIQNNQPIDIYNNGDMQRDFTYIDDIVEGIINVSLNPPKNSDTINSHSRAPHKILNIGNNKPVALIDFIELIESAMSKKAIKNMLPMQPGDVKTTYADIDELIRDYNFKPRTSIKDGINSFIKWYNSYEIK